MNRLSVRWVRVALGGVLCLSCFAAGGRPLLGANTVAPNAAVRNEAEHNISPAEVEILLSELLELKRQISAFDGKRGFAPKNISDLKDSINELEMRLREVALETKHRDSLTAMNEHFTSENLELATTWIHWVIGLFTIALSIVGVLSFQEFKRLKAELAGDRRNLKKEVGGALEKMNAVRDEIGAEVAVFKSQVEVQREANVNEMMSVKGEIDAQNTVSERTRAFVQAVAEHFFSDALLELLSALHENGVLADDADKKVRDKTREIQARLALMSPDATRWKQAILDLMSLGSEDALLDLSKFAGEPRTDTELRTLAHQAMIKISGRKGLSPAA